MAEDTSWILDGEEGLQRKNELDVVSRMKKERSAPRFWLKNDEKSVIVFCDDDPKGEVKRYIREHNMKFAGKFGNYFTCTKKKDGGGVCAICDSAPDDNKSPVFTAYYTVIDTRSFTRKDGTVVKNKKMLYPAKGETVKRVAELVKKYGSLRGKAFDVSRGSGSTNPNCGMIYDLVKEDVDLSKLPDTVPYDYTKILAPPTPEELGNQGFHAAEAEAVAQQGEVTADKEITDIEDLF